MKSGGLGPSLLPPPSVSVGVPEVYIQLDGGVHPQCAAGQPNHRHLATHLGTRPDEGESDSLGARRNENDRYRWTKRYFEGPGIAFSVRVWSSQFTII